MPTGPDQPAAIEVEGVTKSFAGARAVAGASLHVARGEVVSLLGPSGSGKTTLLRIIAGFELADAGRVRIGGRVVADDRTFVEPEQRHIGMVFQQGALFPHLTVAGNVEFGATSRQGAEEAIALVGLARRGKAYPHELSGGERQRVALARALAAEPEVVLLDEPFAALDAGLREALRDEVAEILRVAGVSALLVTHDQAEGLSIADRVVVIRDGCVEQAGTPEEVYERPTTRWLAEFLGETDVVPGTARDGTAECALGRFAVSPELAGPVDILLRPESVSIAHRGGDSEATVVARSFYGHDQLVHLELADGMKLRSRQLGFPAWHPGDRVSVSISGPVTALPR